MEITSEPRPGNNFPSASIYPIESAQYWRSQGARWPPLLDLPLDRPRGSVWSANTAQNHYLVTPNAAAGVRSAVCRLGMPAPAVLLSCITLLLYRLTRQNSLVVGYVPSTARDGATLLPIVSEGGLALTIDQLLSGIDQAISAAEEHALSYRKIQALAGRAADASLAGLVEVQLSYLEAGRDGGAAAGNRSAPSLPAADLAFDFRESADKLSLAIRYNAAILDGSTIDRWAGHFDAIASHLDLPGETLIARVPIMNGDECRRILTRWNQTAAGYPRDQTVAEVFTQTAAASPGSIALSFSETRLTYGELEAKANQLAHGLAERGIGRGSRVALSCERSIDSIVAILGVLKAGAAYVPIDASYPDSRVGFMLHDAAVEAILTSSAYFSRFIPFGFPLMLLDAEWPALALMPDSPPAIDGSAEDLAYVIYTSGSTGTPKGVLVPQRGIVRLVRNTNYASFSPGEVFLQLAPMSFDASVFEIFGALLNGLHLVIAPPDGNSPEVLARTIRANGVTTLWLTAAFFHLIAAEHLEALRPLRQVLAGGDALSPAHVRLVLEGLPHLRLVNGYGPTENTAFSACHPITLETLLPTGVPLGRPISNSRVYILDRLLQPLPAGIPGELFLAGDGLALGYLNKPELTRERFFEVELPGIGRQRLYRTGDMGRYRPDGTIEFLGRIDEQVKIRGYRIELGEIETALQRFPAISSAAVTVFEDPAVPGDRRLAAYVVPAPGAPSNRAEFIADIHRRLRASLPAYMQPSAVVVLDELPQTVNGKLDRRNLPAPQTECTVQYAPPRDQIESRLVAIWEEVLDRQGIGIEDNFFDTGGYSLTIVRLFTRINKTFKASLPITAIFNAPTIAQLAAVLRGRTIYSALVPVQTQGTKPPLFLLHSYLLYGGLPQAIGEDQPIYGLRELEDDGDIDIRERAARYIAEMRKVRPYGPYYLAGWSAAGPIAVEVSGQLSQAGEKVALTLLFDSIRPGYEEEMAGANRAARTSLRKHPAIEKLLFHAHHLGKLPLPEKLIYIRGNLRRRLENARENFLTRHWSALERLSKRFGFKLPDVLHNVSYRTFAALNAYRGDRIPNRITLLRAADSGNLPHSSDDLGWGQMTTAGVEVLFAPGTHETMFREPHLSNTAAMVRDLIERSGGLA